MITVAIELAALAVVAGLYAATTLGIVVVFRAYRWTNRHIDRWFCRKP